MTTPKHEISQYFALKNAINQLLGERAWTELKECTSLATWRRHSLRLLDAISISIRETVRIRDEDWVAQINDNLGHGTKLLKSAKDMDDLLSALSATLLRLVFLQVGLLPSRQSAENVTLRKQNWRLDKHRSVQIVQNLDQREAVFWSKKQKEIGTLSSGSS